MDGVRLATKPVYTFLPTLNKVAGVLLAVFGVILYVDPALAAAAPAGNLTGYAGELGKRTNLIPQLINYCAFILGAILFALGISDLRRHVENPGNTPMRSALGKIFFGAMFLMFPFMMGIAFDTFVVDFDPLKLKKANAVTVAGATINDKGLSGMIKNGVNQALVLIDVATFIGFIIATFLTMRGIQMLRAHVENPSQAPLPDAIKRLVVGGLLFSLPVIGGIVVKTFGATADPMKANYNMTGATAGGLDGMMVNFIKDITNPAFFGIEVFCYIAGILMILFAMQRLVRTAQDGPRGPLGFGTIVMFIVAGVLLSFPQFLSTMDNSIFNSGAKSLTEVQFMKTIEDAGNTTAAKNVFKAILAFMAVIGFLSVVRGLFLLKSFADGGQQASMMSVVTHIVAGSIAINLGTFINAVQTSLGVTDFAVTFK